MSDERSPKNHSRFRRFSSFTSVSFQRVDKPLNIRWGHLSILRWIGPAIDLRKGAFHFLQKPIEPTALLEAIAQSYAYVQDKKDAIENTADIRRRIESLTAREQEVAELLSQGFLNGDIAKKLHLSIRTVEVYHANVYVKLGVKQVAAVARIWKKFKN